MLLTKLGELEKTMTKMQKLLELQSQQITEQNRRLGQLESRTPGIQMPSAGTGPEAAVQTAPMSEGEFNQRLGQSLGGSEKWLKDLKFSGDFRLRYDAFANHGADPNPDRNRFRFRLRYGFEKKFGEELKTGFVITTQERTTNTGHNADPTSNNQTMGNLFDAKNIWINKAFVTYNPKWIQVGPISGLELTAGKFDNPFEKGSTDMVWKNEVKPEGAAETLSLKVLEAEKVRLNSYFTAGQYILQESSAAGRDAEMYGYQFGLQPVFDIPFFEKPVESLGAVTYYDYSNYDRQMNWRIDQTAAGASLANGNSICSTTELCTGFKVMEYYGELKVTPYGLPIRPFADAAHNFEAGRSMRSRDAWSLGIKIGELAKKGSWQGQYQYKWIGADSVPGAFNDTDFGYRGFSGNKGSAIRLAYMLTDYMSLNSAAFIVRNLNIGSALDANSNDTINSEQQSRFQLDLTWKF